ncbi:Uncharacterized protein Fot_17581 [Forsythia ovata]|uniref:Uncharacterized protein n=1 Tax=Forsythia ovata TaxID=205694 RepID=A0ABD1VFS0_9LAMI
MANSSPTILPISNLQHTTDATTTTTQQSAVANSAVCESTSIENSFSVDNPPSGFEALDPSATADVTGFKSHLEYFIIHRYLNPFLTTHPINLVESRIIHVLD